MANAYERARQNAGKSAARGKQQFDKKVHSTVLQSGDRVLVRNLSEIGGPGKLRAHWEKEIYVVVERKAVDSPVYEIRPESGRGRHRTLHRNLLLPCSDLPGEYQDTAKSPCRQQTGAGRRTRQTCEDESGSSDSDSTEDELLVSTPPEMATTLNVEAPTFIPESNLQPQSNESGGDQSSLAADVTDEATHLEPTCTPRPPTPADPVSQPAATPVPEADSTPAVALDQVADSPWPATPEPKADPAPDDLGTDLGPSPILGPVMDASPAAAVQCQTTCPAPAPSPEPDGAVLDTKPDQQADVPEQPAGLDGDHTTETVPQVSSDSRPSRDRRPPQRLTYEQLGQPQHQPDRINEVRVQDPRQGLQLPVWPMCMTPQAATPMMWPPYPVPWPPPHVTPWNPQQMQMFPWQQCYVPPPTQQS